MLPPGSIIFLVSDFLDGGSGEAAGGARRRHDVVALVLEDRRDRELPDVGLIEVEEPESGSPLARHVLRACARVLRGGREDEQRAAAAFQRAGIDTVPLDTLADWVEPLTASSRPGSARTRARRWRARR